MYLQFLPPKDATLFDICINTYGSLDLLYKLINDNNITNINALATGFDRYIFDYSLVVNYDRYQKIQNETFRFVTGQKEIRAAFEQPTENYLQTETPDILQSEQDDLFIVD